MKRIGRSILIIIVVFIALFFIIKLVKKVDFNTEHRIGDAIDSLKGVIVYYNGGIDHTEGRNITDGYNVGLKYQCVEFVKRYYLEYYKHKMPDSYGHAKSFFDKGIVDGNLNSLRGLIQFTNPSKSKPQTGDLLVFDGNVLNPYGHVAIISEVTDNSVQIIQQNPGPYSASRETFKMFLTDDGKHKIQSKSALGWLRKD